ncbi:hypothetical protein ABIC09_004886 [Bradyrhizobium sp. S3.12.5]|uniref:hypothetical protein n=1 Tax=Bradyrhizobium sp. S3.12.5 TaxID=3156386 RepID=UPI0033976162
MAKKAKASRTAKAAKKTKVAKTTKKGAAARRTGSATVPLHKVVHFVRLLQRKKRAAKFIAHAKNNDASITISGASQRIINNFLAQHNLQGDACPDPDPWKCT